MDEVAQQYARQSIRFIKVDTAQLAYSDLIKMGITSVPVIRLHTQVNKDKPLPHDAVEPPSCLSLCLLLKPYKGDCDCAFQVKRLTYSGDRTLSALTQYITNYTVSPIHSSMQTGTEADAASVAMPSYWFLQEIAVVPQQNSDQLAFDLNQTVYTKAPEQVGQ